jgi:UDP-N-acetylglucosamine--N-acetylmuramyl-(pentapeptide) pyrophosphoryl-undecaprenol N-acetylglucosamine transferase
MGKPAIVIPYPHAIGDHQAKNAAALESASAVRIVRDDALKNGVLVTEMINIIKRPEDMADMAENSRRLGKPKAALDIASELLNLQRS